MRDAGYGATLGRPHGKETSISHPVSRNPHRVRPRETDKLFFNGSLVGQRHFHGASTSERVPLLAVVNERTTRAGVSTTASSERHRSRQHCLELRWPIQDGEPVMPTPSSGTPSVEFGEESGAVQLMTKE